MNRLPNTNDLKNSFLQYKNAMTDEWRKSKAPFDFACLLAGDRNKKLRQSFLLQLTGQSLPISKCGIHAIEKELEKL